MVSIADLGIPCAQVGDARPPAQTSLTRLPVGDARTSLQSLAASQGRRDLARPPQPPVGDARAPPHSLAGPVRPGAAAAAAIGRCAADRPRRLSNQRRRSMDVACGALGRPNRDRRRSRAVLDRWISCPGRLSHVAI